MTFLTSTNTLKRNLLKSIQRPIEGSDARNFPSDVCSSLVPSSNMITRWPWLLHAKSTGTRRRVDVPTTMNSRMNWCVCLSYTCFHQTHYDLIEIERYDLTLHERASLQLHACKTNTSTKQLCLCESPDHTTTPAAIRKASCVFFVCAWV